MWICKNKFTRTCVVEHGKINNYEIYLNFINLLWVFIHLILFSHVFSIEFCVKKEPTRLHFAYVKFAMLQRRMQFEFPWMKYVRKLRKRWLKSRRQLLMAYDTLARGSFTNEHTFPIRLAVLQQFNSDGCFGVEHFESHHLIPTNSLNRIASSTQKKNSIFWLQPIPFELEI